jgi:hypothetical protein
MGYGLEGVVLAGGVAALLLVLWLAFRAIGDRWAARLAASWFAVAFAGIALLHSASDSAQGVLWGGPTWGAFIPADQQDAWRSALVVVPPTVTVYSGGDAQLSVSAISPDGESLEVVWASTEGFDPVPHGCSHEDRTGTLRYIRCPVGKSVNLWDFIEWQPTGSARFQGSAQYLPARSPYVDFASVKASASARIRYDTWDPTGKARFERVVAGEPNLTAQGIEFLDSAQSADSWVSAIEMVRPRPAWVQDIVRDSALLVLGGAFTLALVPPSDLRRPQPRVGTSMPRRRQSGMTTKSHRHRDGIVRRTKK